MAYFKQNRHSFIITAYIKCIIFVEKYIGPLLFLGVRLWMGQIFWYSGMSKAQCWWTTVMLFKDEYKVPYLPPELAAYLTVGIEIICPIFLVLGLGTRLATIPLLIMTGIIQLTYVQSTENLYWTFLLGFLLCYGPGPLSLDYFFWKRYTSKEKNHFR